MFARRVLPAAALALLGLPGCGPQVVSVQDQLQAPPEAAKAPEPVGLTPEEATRQVPTLRPLPGRRRVRPPAFQAPAPAPDPDPAAAFAAPPPAPPASTPTSGEGDEMIGDEYAPDA